MVAAEEEAPLIRPSKTVQKVMYHQATVDLVAEAGRFLSADQVLAMFPQPPTSIVKIAGRIARIVVGTRIKSPIVLAVEHVVHSNFKLI